LNTGVLVLDWNGTAKTSSLPTINETCCLGSAAGEHVGFRVNDAPVTDGGSAEIIRGAIASGRLFELIDADVVAGWTWTDNK
jgi:hypothetical protein